MKSGEPRLPDVRWIAWLDGWRGCRLSRALAKQNGREIEASHWNQDLGKPDERRKWASPKIEKPRNDLRSVKQKRAECRD